MCGALQPSIRLLAARTCSLRPGKRRHRGDKHARRAARFWTVSFAAASLVATDFVARGKHTEPGR